MRRKILLFGGIAAGIVVVLVILVGPAAPLLVKLGAEPVCIQGDWPDLKLVSCPEEGGIGVTVTAMPIPSPGPDGPVPVLFDDDGSPDGMVALLFLLSDPRYDVQAVTVSPGEAHPRLFAGHVSRLLDALGRPDVAVGYGREAPLEGDNAFPEPWRQSSDAFFGVTLPGTRSVTAPVPAAALIVRTLSEATRPMLVFLSGTHTNLAEALRLEPSIGDKVLGIYVMGGAVQVPGNIESDWPGIANRVAEWNIWVDPVAAHEIFVSGIPLHLVPLDATDKVAWMATDATTWADAGTPEGVLAAQILEEMLRSWSAESVYLWDLVAAATMTDARLCVEEPRELDVVVEPGPEQGRTAVVDGDPNTQVCLDPDADQIRARVAAIFSRR